MKVNLWSDLEKKLDKDMCAGSVGQLEGQVKVTVAALGSPEGNGDRPVSPTLSEG